MKSLSPNAQEFVPLTPSQVTSHIYYITNEEASPIAYHHQQHQPVQFGYLNPNVVLNGNVSPIVYMQPGGNGVF
jgi:hypothetical protein